MKNSTHGGSDKFSLLKRVKNISFGEVTVNLSPPILWNCKEQVLGYYKSNFNLTRAKILEAFHEGLWQTI